MNYNWSDKHDYFNEIDEGYISIKEFLFYNKILPIYRDTHTDNEVFSMVLSELED